MDRPEMPLTQRKGMHVHAISIFLWHLWHSAAEGLPHKLIEKSKDEEHSTRRLSWTNRKMRQAEMGATHVPDPDSDQEIDALATRAGVHTSSESDGGNGDAVAVSTTLHRMLEAHDVRGSLRHWVDSLPKRWLPPGRKVWIYWQYVAHCQEHGDSVAAWSTFKRVWAKHFKTRLGFRKVSEPALCSTCEGFKNGTYTSLRLESKASHRGGLRRASSPSMARPVCTGKHGFSLARVCHTCCVVTA